MTALAGKSGGGIHWPLAFAVALGTHLALAGFIALRPVTPPPPPPAPLPAIMMDLAPPAPPPPPPPPAPAPKPVVQPPPVKPPPVIERAVAKLPPVPPKPPKQDVSPDRAPPVPDAAPTAAQTTDTAPSLSSSAPSGPPPADAMAAFQGRLMAHLARHKRYPMAARQRRQQGTAWVRLTIDRHGRVLAHRLERGCGVDALDREAEELLARAQPLPEIPEELKRDQMELVLPVEFSLK